MDDLQCKIDNAMTGRDLIQAIEESGAHDAPIFFVVGYGDRSNTQQALPVEDVVTDKTTDALSESAYSESGIKYDEDTPARGTDQIIIME